MSKKIDEKDTKWIPTKEKNPPMNGRYIAVCNGIRSPVIRVYKNGWSSLQEVTHWQPLPKMPNEGG